MIIERRKFLEMASFVVAVIVFAVMFYSTRKPETNLRCTFNSLPGQAPIRLGNFTAPINRIELEAAARTSSVNELYSLEGKAHVWVDGHGREADTRGDVFTADDSTVNGLTLTVEDSAFGPDGLRVVTLNNQGQLDFDESTAFAFTDPRFKRSHPLKFRCEGSLPKGGKAAN